MQSLPLFRGEVGGGHCSRVLSRIAPTVDQVLNCIRTAAEDPPAMANKVRLSKLKRLPKVEEATYDVRLTELQRKLERAQHAYLFTGDRAVIVFEGMDAAGKGGTI